MPDAQLPEQRAGRSRILFYIARQENDVSDDGDRSRETGHGDDVPPAIREATERGARAVTAGDLVVYPTETV